MKQADAAGLLNRLTRAYPGVPRPADEKSEGSVICRLRLPAEKRDTMGNKDKRAKIMDATVSIVAEYGFHGAFMEKISDTAGVGAGTIYRYFESKDHLVQQTYRKLERRCLVEVMKDYPAHASIRQRFSHLAQRLIWHCLLFPAAFLFMDQFHSSPYRKTCIPEEPPAAELCSVVDLFREGTEKKLFRDMPPDMLLAVACGPVIQAMRLNAAGRMLNDDRIARIVESCWGAVFWDKA
jgi:AcrR family transcriptional regulator